MNIIGGLITKISVAVAALAVIACIYLHKVNVTLESKVSQQTTDLKALTYGTASYKDQYDKWHSVSIQQNETIQLLKYNKDSLSLAYNKLLAQYKIKPKEVTEIGSVSTRLDAHTTVKYVPRDTTYDLSTRPYIVEQIKIKNDSLTRDLQVNNTQQLVWHTKRETINPPNPFFLIRWFQKKQNVTYVDIINDNPFIKTTNQDFHIITK